MTMTKQARKTAIMTGLFGVGLATGVSVRWIDGLPQPVVIALTLATFALIVWAAFYCWYLLDEAQREAHKWAWYWGGSTGLLVGMIAVSVALRIDPNLAEAIQPNGTSKTFVELGFVAATTSTLIGYGVAWAAWWMTRR